MTTYISTYDISGSSVVIVNNSTNLSNSTNYDIYTPSDFIEYNY